MADKIPFDLVSPERLLLTGAADMITVPGSEGYFAIGPGHMPLVATLKPGVVDVEGGPNGKERFFVSAGFVEVAPTKATILAEEALPMANLTAQMVEQRVADAREDVLQARTDEARAKAVQALDALELLRSYL